MRKKLDKSKNIYGLLLAEKLGSNISIRDFSWSLYSDPGKKVILTFTDMKQMI